MVPAMPIYPGDPHVAFSPAAALAVDGFRVSQVTFGTHAGTHVDAPSHFLPLALTVDAIPLDKLIGPARVVDQQALRFPIEIEPQARILVRSGWSAHWGSDDYFDAFPPLSADFVESLAAGPAALIGLETPSLHPDHEIDAGYHRRLLAAGVVIVENLVGLEALPEKVEAAFLPLPLAGLDGAPCRGVAWWD